jgi:hypothetical protein
MWGTINPAEIRIYYLWRASLECQYHAHLLGLVCWIYDLQTWPILDLIFMFPLNPLHLLTINGLFHKEWLSSVTSSGRLYSHSYLSGHLYSHSYLSTSFGLQWFGYLRLVFMRYMLRITFVHCSYVCWQIIS